MLFPACFSILALSGDKMSADFCGLRYLLFDKVYLRYFFFCKLYRTRTDFNLFWLRILFPVEVFFSILTLVVLLIIIVILLIFFLFIFNRLLRRWWRSLFRSWCFWLLRLLLEGLTMAHLRNLSFRRLCRLFIIGYCLEISLILSFVLVLILWRRLAWLLLFGTCRVV